MSPSPGRCQGGGSASEKSTTSLSSPQSELLHRRRPNTFQQTRLLRLNPAPEPPRHQELRKKGRRRRRCAGRNNKHAFSPRFVRRRTQPPRPSEVRAPEHSGPPRLHAGQVTSPCTAALGLIFPQAAKTVPFKTKKTPVTKKKPHQRPRVTSQQIPPEKGFTRCFSDVFRL